MTKPLTKSTIKPEKIKNNSKYY